VPRLTAFLRALLLLAVASDLGAQIAAAEFAARREAAVKDIADGIVLVLNTPAPVPDYLPWQPSRPFFYLTGFREPDAALVMVRRNGSTRTLLFVPPRDPVREVWNGTRLGVEGVQRTLGLEGRDVTTLDAVLDSLLRDTRAFYAAGDFEGPWDTPTPHARRIARLLERHSQLQLTDLGPVIASLRGRKSAAELDRLRIAAEISARGHLAAMRVIQPGVAEFEAQAAAEHVWRREGADGPGYASIVGSGPNATILHYNASTRIAQAGELMLMDMAAAFDLYSADITRTVPVSGRFSPAQRDIYEVVLAAVKAAERQVRAGAPARRMSDSSNAVLREGLTRLGLLDATDPNYDCGTGARPRRCSQLSLFYMHGLGHGIGLDVHDPDQYEQGGVIGVGSAFTIEPGIYVRAHLAEIIPQTPANREYLARIAEALARFGGIGVRIEDDFLVTAQGVLRASAGVPREIDEVERVMAEPRTPRDPAVTERFLRNRTGQ
jgi:Xaa-Pro aminopeptidase